MVDATERLAVELGVYGRARCDLGESDFGRRVAESWCRSEQHRRTDETLHWQPQQGWVGARPSEVIDYSTPEAVRHAEISRLRPPRVDDEVIDLSTDEARELNRRGTPRLVAS
jgi:hypothetical protein